VQALFPESDFKRLVRALYGEHTFLMKLRVTAETDIDALIKYWGRGGSVQAHRPLLEALAQMPGGGSIGVGGLLPPFARLRLYTYANPAVDPTATAQNCLWTAMNFFNEKPDNRFLNPGSVQQVLASDYQIIPGPPAFGDLIGVLDGAGAPVHLCVYLADDVVFTKNGRDYIEPWVLMKVPDVIASYRTRESTRVAIFRSIKR
jgi:hypothetical protein